MTEQRLSVGTSCHRPLFPTGSKALETDCEQPCAESARPFVLIATILASAMAFIDGSVVNIALPAIQGDLDAGFQSLQWVFNAYALTLGGLILVGGAAGDRLGRRRVFIGGIGVFAVASLACALAPTITTLIIARGAQGVGAALLVPQSLAIIAAAFPKGVRGRAIGIWAGASAIATAFGPPVGGFLIDALDWRVVFWINLPFSVIAVLLAVRYVPESGDTTASGPLDWRGGVLAVVGLGLVTVGLTRLVDSTGVPATSLVLWGAGLAGLVWFVRVERKVANPLVPLALFRDRAFSGANAITLFLYGALSGVLFLLPFELIERRGMTATEVGLSLLPIGIIIGSLSRSAGSIAERIGPRVPLAVGSVMVAIAAGGLAIGFDGYRSGVLTPVVLLSLGMAIVVAPLTTAIMNAAPDAQAGAASGVNNAASRLASLFAVAVIGAAASAIFAGAISGDPGIAGGHRFGELPGLNDAGRMVLEGAFVEAYSAAMWIAAGWAALAALLALLLLGPARRAPLG